MFAVLTIKRLISHFENVLQNILIFALNFTTVKSTLCY